MSEISSTKPESAPATILGNGLTPNAPIAPRNRVPDCDNGPRVRDCVYNFFYDLQIAHAFYNYISRAHFVVI